MALVTRRSRLGEVMAAANPAPPGTGATTATSQVGAAPPTPPSDAAGWWGRAVIVAVLGVIAGGLILWRHNPPVFNPGTGISAFAPLYIIAQAIERILEPAKKILAKKVPATGLGDKAAATANRNNAVAEATTSPHPADTGLSDAEKTANVAKRVADAALAQRELDDLRSNRTAILWGASTALAMIACGYFGVGLLHAIGETGAPRYVDMFVTGFAVGGGTKPLHDFISNLQTSSQQSATPQAAGGS
jgi:hypothetical protein